jgi:SlyX protein
MSEQITDLEIRLTYQESALQELNDVIVKQQDQIDALIVEVRRLRQQLASGSEFVRPQSEETPPPHY